MIPEMDLGGVFCCFCYFFFSLLFFANGMELNGMELSFALYSCSCSFLSLSLSLSLSRFLLASRDWGNWILETGAVGGGGGYWIWGVRG